MIKKKHNFSHDTDSKGMPIGLIFLAIHRSAQKPTIWFYVIYDIVTIHKS